MSKSPKKFYEELNDMFQTPGWANLKSVIEDNLTAIEKHGVDQAGTAEALYQLKGRLEIIRFILGYQGLTEKALDQLNAPEPADPEVE